MNTKYGLEFTKLVRVNNDFFTSLKWEACLSTQMEPREKENFI